MYCLPQLYFFWSALLFLAKNTKPAVENCYSSVITRVVHVTKPILSPATKDLLSLLQKVPSSTNTSATATVGTWEKHLNGYKIALSIKYPKCLTHHHTSTQRLLLDRKCKKKQTNPEYKSTIGQHVLKSNRCTANHRNIKSSY